MTPDDTLDLSGKRIIVVEDDYLLAMDICRELRDLGASVLGPAPTPFYAMQLIGRRKIDAAVLDVRLHGATVFDVADVLHSHGVPMIFATGSVRDTLPERFRHLSVMTKPLDHTRLVTELVEMTNRPAVQAPGPLSNPIVAGQKLAPAHSFARALGRRMAGGLTRA